LIEKYEYYGLHKEFQQNDEPNVWYIPNVPNIPDNPDAWFFRRRPYIPAPKS